PVAAQHIRGNDLPGTVALDQGVELLDPVQVFNLMQTKQCILIDVRDKDRDVGVIEGAAHEPTSFERPLFVRVPELVKKYSGKPLIIFHCQYSCHRARQSANWYCKQADLKQRVAVLDGGFRGWQKLNLPVRCPTLSGTGSDQTYACFMAAEFLCKKPVNSQKQA
ncbi:ACR2.2, partial [Symbiodinium pilosum]